jgi:hypothetical protein
MSELLDPMITAHGGLDRWNAVYRHAIHIRCEEEVQWLTW